jgi:hypothetical protein
VAIIVLLLVWQEIQVLRSSPLIYELPDHLRGWIMIQYGDPACAALDTRDKALVIPIPRSGCLCTSTPVPEGWRSTRYEYIGKDGSRKKIPSGAFWEGDSMILAGSVGPYGKYLRERFFLGTRDELKNSGPWPIPPFPGEPLIPESKKCDDLDIHAGIKK